MSLRNRTVLVTRQQEQASELIEEVEKRGGEVLLFPTIRILPPESWDACDRVSTSLPDYNGLFVTSTNGAVRFFNRLRERNIPFSSLGNCRIYAVGKKTCDAVKGFGLNVHLVPEEFSAASLAKVLPDEVVRGSRYLFPCGNLATGTLERALRERGAIVDTVVVYRTVAPDEMDARPIIQRILAGDIDVISFASPSAARNFVAVIPGDIAPRLFEKARIAVIGPTTQKALRELGLRADIVAAEATSSGLARAIEQHFE